jgi:hypothetical protein
MGGWDKSILLNHSDGGNDGDCNGIAKSGRGNKRLGVKSETLQ